jgi:excisionase family DNA binding protein
VEDKPYLSVEDVASILGISVDTVRNYISRRKNPLPAYRFGREYRINKEEFDEWVKTNRVQPSDGKQ